MILCENPKYIVHPHARKRIAQFGNYTLNGKPHFSDFSYIVSSPMKEMKDFWNACAFMTEEFAQKSYVADTRTGETYPLFMEVPCGHCVLCREKKRKSLSFRCQAETNYWASQGAPTPLFVTLTYNNVYLPRTDSQCPTLRGSDVTLFLKRLRQNLIRRYNADVVAKLRYCLCGEYGSKTHRPHYHILFWNFPNLGSSDSTRNLVSCIHVIQDSWSTIVDYVKNPVTGVPEPVYSPLGFISCYEATTGASGYIAKYIGKQVPFSLPEDCEPPFIRRSCGRLGGLGNPWLQAWILQNPDSSILDKSSWTLIDPYTGKSTHTRVLPKYFINKVYPTSSSLITTSVRYSLRMLECRWSQLSSLGRFNHFYRRVDKYLDNRVPLYGDIERIFNKFDYFADFQRFGAFRGYDLDIDALVRYYGFQKVRSYLWHCIDYLVKFLNSYDYDKTLANKHRDMRKVYYSRICAPQDTTKEELNWLIESKKRAENLAMLREVF